ncbi:hypothetical protein [Bradyrhizobium sp. CCBAU 11361]|uniref:hypothetical protein n=1 Tax=Bradyrhizobium sp. CCBAU 11361 TaxID=1630812 RepID=UPI0023035222|nr:hypothetical protein [Bradyrhizobium sp. CCBAU 11361]MDA9490409.1 hypothetical protein [Bradyrhizobium sp. CCBAU 11361]
MFEVGREYVFHIIEDSPGGSGVTEAVWKVEAIKDHLLKLTSPHEKASQILNTASSRFVKAIPMDELFPKSRKSGGVSREPERFTEEPN